METIEVTTTNGKTVLVEDGTCIDFTDPHLACYASDTALIALSFHPQLSKIVQTIFTLRDGVFAFNGLLDLIGTPKGVMAKLIGNGNTGGLVHTGDVYHGMNDDFRDRETGFFSLNDDALVIEVQAHIRFDSSGTPPAQCNE